MSTDLQHAIAELERNMRSVVLGKPEVVRMCLVALLAGEHVLLEDVPGVGKTLVGKALARSLSGRFLPAAVHARPVAQRYRRQQSVQLENLRIRVQTRPDLCQRRLGGRNQPGPATDPKRLAGSHERQPGFGGRRDLQPAQTVHGHRDAEPLRVRGHVRLAGKPAGSVPAADFHGISGSGSRAASPGLASGWRAGGATQTGPQLRADRGTAERSPAR